MFYSVGLLLSAGFVTELRSESKIRHTCIEIALFKILRFVVSMSRTETISR